MAMRRRGFLLGAAAGACAALGAEATDDAQRRAAVSPPGSDAARLHARCTGCNLCVAKCPTKVIKAATFEYGLGGTMMPVMDFTRGFCEKECVRCGEVCPTGAIRRLSKEEKSKTKIGRASLVVGWEEKCLACKEGYVCSLCQKHCPYGAVKVVEEKRKGEAPVRRPAIDAAICVGCGACVHVCPVNILTVRT